jgi:DNA end-binding protein Ku
LRSIWNGSLSFGLINIPIRVYSATIEHAIEFDMLHKKDLSPIRFARICKEDGTEVPFKEIVKGYEYEKGQYVVVDEEDFKAANAKKTSTIEIQHFTDLFEIDPMYYEKPYYLEPDKKSGKAYGLLRDALSASNKVAVATFVFRNKERLGVIIALGDTLVLLQLRFHLEIRSSEELDLPKGSPSSKELEMALNLINEQTMHFNPEKFHDTYAEELMRVIEMKLSGKKPSTKTLKQAPATDAKDLMSLLKASMKKEGTLSKKDDLKVIPTKSKSKKRPARKKTT